MIHVSCAASTDRAQAAHSPSCLRNRTAATSQACAARIGSAAKTWGQARCRSATDCLQATFDVCSDCSLATNYPSFSLIAACNLTNSFLSEACTEQI